MNENITIGSTVELKTGFEEVYQASAPGQRGCVRKTKDDEYGYPLVYIEWDKDHWKYMGEPDGWTFASHFDILEAPEEKHLMRGLLDPDERGLIGPDELCPNCGGYHTKEEEDAAEAYIEAIMEAFDAAADSAGFLLIALEQIGDPDSEGVHMFQPNYISAALNEDSAKALEMLKKLLRRR